MTPREMADAFALLANGNYPPCPECGHGVLMVTEVTIVEEYLPAFQVRGKPLPTRKREALAAACNACEFIAELKLCDDCEKRGREK